MPRAVFLDRDGVLNATTVRDGTAYPPARAEDVVILPFVREALARLAQHNLRLIVVTNQPDVARGTQTRDAVERINQHLAEQLPIDAVFTCYHDNADRCDCRKPRPGMLVQAAREHQIDLRASFMVGDRWSDVVAGQAAGCTTFLLETPYSQRQRCTPDYVVANLRDAADLILGIVANAAPAAGEPL
jgi:D-glycero-D-manno-heptose 1,7-bisphosphate phosphatase